MGRMGSCWDEKGEKLKWLFPLSRKYEILRIYRSRETGQNYTVLMKPYRFRKTFAKIFKLFMCSRKVTFGIRHFLFSRQFSPFSYIFATDLAMIIFVSALFYEQINAISGIEFICECTTVQ